MIHSQCQHVPLFLSLFFKTLVTHVQLLYVQRMTPNFCLTHILTSNLSSMYEPVLFNLYTILLHYYVTVSCFFLFNRALLYWLVFTPTLTRPLAVVQRTMTVLTLSSCAVTASVSTDDDDVTASSIATTPLTNQIVVRYIFT